MIGIPATWPKQQEIRFGFKAISGPLRDDIKPSNCFGAARPVWLFARLAAILQPMSEKVRRLIALFLALTLVVAGTTQLVQASDMAIKMSASTSMGDMPMPGGCDGCSGGDDGMTMACFAVCGNTTAAILPFAPAVASIGFVSPTASFVTAVAGHHRPPDPYPPRPTRLG